MFTIGTGVGGGLVLNGKLYRGATSAAELGHTMIGLDLADGAPADPGAFPQPGSLETLASGRALDRLALESARAHPKSFLGRRLAKGDEITGHDAVEGAREGDVHCQHVIRVLGERLGIGIANAINTFDPDEVVIGGGVSLAGDLLLVPAERTARRHTVPGAGAEHEDPARPPRPAGRRARRGDGRRAGVGAARLERKRETRASRDEDRVRVRPRGLPAQAGRARDARGGRPRADRPRHVLDRARSTTPTPRAARPTRCSTARAERAVVVCGSGAGVAVAACKVPGIRAATAHDTYTAHQAVEHDDVNVLCLGARVIGPALRGRDHRRVLARGVLRRGAPRAPAGEDRGHRARVHGRELSPWPSPASTRATTSRSPSTGSSATCTRSRSSARTARSTGTAARRSTRRACSARSSTRTDGGFYSIRPTGDDWTSKQLYFPDTNVLITRFFTHGGVGEVQDFMPIEAQPDMHRHRLLRRVVVVRGTMEFEIEVQPRFDYGREEHEVELHPHGVLFRAPSLTLALEGAIAKTMGGADARARARRAAACARRSRSRPGDSQTFVLERVPAGPHLPARTPERETARGVRGDRRRTGAAGSSSRATAAAGARWCTARRSR